MVALSPVLRSRLTVMRGAERISDETTASFYQVVAGDAEGNLGENPSGAYIDELLTQPNRELYDAIRTGLGHAGAAPPDDGHHGRERPGRVRGDRAGLV